MWSYHNVVSSQQASHVEQLYLVHVLLTHCPRFTLVQHSREHIYAVYAYLPICFDVMALSKALC